MERRVGPCRLVALLGRGGMGEVWRATDSSHGDRAVAVKLLGAWLAGDPEFGRRFRRESALAAGLTNPHIVPIHRYGEIDGQLYIEMQLVDGIDLAALVGRVGPLPAARAAQIVTHVSNALTTAHASGLVHRDVKPTNILVRTDDGTDHAYLIDFGIARAVDATHTSLSGALIGTLAYMAPERFAGDGDHRADIYALGCVLHEAVTGQKPFTSTNPLMLLNAHQNVMPPPPSSLQPGVGSAFDAVVARALAKDPGDRYQTVTEFAAAVRLASPPQTRTETLVAAPPPSPRTDLAPATELAPATTLAPPVEASAPAGGKIVVLTAVLAVLALVVGGAIGAFGPWLLR